MKKSTNWHNVFPEVPEEFHERVTNTLANLEKTETKETTNRKGIITMKTKNNSKKKTIIAVAAAAAVLGAFTVSAATAGLWQGLFANNPKLLENMQTDANYEVVASEVKADGGNLVTALDGYTLEISALYADSDSIFLAVDVTADEPVFAPKDFDLTGLVLNETESGLFTEVYNPEFLDIETFRHWNLKEDPRMSAHIQDDIIDDYHKTILFYFSDPTEEITAGKEFTLALYDGFDALYAGDSSAEIRFIIDKIAPESDIHIYPNVEISDGKILTELKINPFGIRASLIKADDADIIENYNDSVSFIMKDGSVVPVNSHSGYTATWENGVERGINFNYESTVDVSQIAAVVYGGTEIAIDN